MIAVHTSKARTTCRLIFAILDIAASVGIDLACNSSKTYTDAKMDFVQVGAHIKALAVLCKRKALTAEEGDQLVIHWAKELLGQAGNILQASLSPSFPVTTPVDEVLQTPKPSNGSTSAGRLTRSRTKHSNKGGDGIRGKQNDPCPQIVTVIFTIGALALTSPQVKASQVVTLLQTLLTRASGLVGHRKGRGAERIMLKEKVTPEINVHVRVALGKLCLADDTLAKRCIPLFAQVSYYMNYKYNRDLHSFHFVSVCARPSCWLPVA